jgi:hypothetical protein
VVISIATIAARQDLRIWASPAVSLYLNYNSGPCVCVSLTPRIAVSSSLQVYRYRGSQAKRQGRPIAGEGNRPIGKALFPDIRAIPENAMKSVAKRKEEAIGKPTPKRPPSLDEMLDEALDETFPASDPPALTAPRRPSAHGQEKLAARKGT